MKKCPRCTDHLPSSEFYLNASGRLSTYCKDCERQRTSERRNRKIEARKEIVERHKSVPCADCGQSYPTYVMDFDHRIPAAKSFTIGEVIHKPSKATLDELKKEIDKCDVVCSNCHRIRTHGG